MVSTIIILGFVAPALNLFLVVIYLLLSLRSKKFNRDGLDDPDEVLSGSSGPSRSKHSTLIAVNFCFLVFQLISLLV
jgi:hypothetical protein